MRRALAWTVVLLLVLGGAYLGDNLLRGYVEDRAAELIRAELGAAGGAPAVELGGFPFAFSLATRSVPEAHVGVAALPLEISGQQVELTRVVAETGEVRLGERAVTVATMTGSARLGYADLAKVAEAPIEYAGDGRLQLRYTRQVFGRSVSFGVSARPELDPARQVIRLTDPSLELAGNNVDLSQEQLEAIVEPIPVKLDHGLRLTGFVPSEDGVDLGVGGSDLTFPLR